MLSLSIGSGRLQLSHLEPFTIKILIKIVVYVFPRVWFSKTSREIGIKPQYIEQFYVLSFDYVWVSGYIHI